MGPAVQGFRNVVCVGLGLWASAVLGREGCSVLILRVWVLPLRVVGFAEILGMGAWVNVFSAARSTVWIGS